MTWITIVNSRAARSFPFICCQYIHSIWTASSPVVAPRPLQFSEKWTRVTLIYILLLYSHHICPYVGPFWVTVFNNNWKHVRITVLWRSVHEIITVDSLLCGGNILLLFHEGLNLTVNLTWLSCTKANSHVRCYTNFKRLTNNNLWRRKNKLKIRYSAMCDICN